MLSEKSILVPMHRGTKRPMIKDWNNLTLEQSKELQKNYKNCNWGLLLGHPDTNYVDVDIEYDHIYKKFNTTLSLVATTEFGRKSRNNTGHFLYVSADAEKTKTYKDHNQTLLFELRTHGLVTIPNSIYEQDEILYSRNSSTTLINYTELRQFLDDFYLSYIVSELYPKQGQRQEAVLGFTGWLLKNDKDESYIAKLFDDVLAWNHDEEFKLRFGAISSTINKFNEDPNNVAGIGILKNILSEDIISFLKSLFNYPDKTNIIEFFNELYAFINNPKGIWDISYSCYVELQELRNQYAHKKFQQIKDGKIKQIPAINFWLESEEKTIMEKIVYEPGKQYTDKINTWKGWGIQPSNSGDIGPMLHLLSYLFEHTNNDGNHTTNEEKLQWFLNWLAYPLQNPGHKNHTAVLLYSHQQGVGKNLIGYVMQDIYGDNFAQLGDDAFERPFNDYLMGKQFIIGNELTSKDKWNGMEKLKMLITEPQIEINRKFQPILNIKNCVNLLLLSNNPDPLVIKGMDRRFFIWFIENPPLSDVFYQNIFIPWKNNGGSARFFQWLLDRDLTGYSPQSHAPVTSYKEELQEMHISSLELVLKQKLISNSTPDLVTVNWLYNMYFNEVGIRLTPLQIGRAMFSFSSFKKRITLDDSLVTAWAVKRKNYWRSLGGIRWSHYLKDIKN